MDETEILVIGTYTADILIKPLDRLPEPGRLLEVDDIEIQTGGCAANTGAALARLGAKTAVAGRVGDDPFGRMALETLKRRGLNVAAVTVDPDSRTATVAAAVATSGERSLIMRPGAHRTVRPEDLPLDRFPGARVLHFAGITHTPGLLGGAFAAMARRAKERGMFVCFDPAWDFEGRGFEAIEGALPFLDAVTPNDAEARDLTGKDDPEEMADVFLGRGVGTAVIKMGKDGALMKNGRETCRVAAFDVPVVDATGAGDAFVAGFLYGALRNWPLRKRGVLGVATASRCVSALGAQAGLDDLRGVLNLIHEKALPEDRLLFKDDV